MKNQYVIISVSYFEYCMLRMLYKEKKHNTETGADLEGVESVM